MAPRLLTIILTVLKKSAPMRSILLTKQIRGTPYLSACAFGTPYHVSNIPHCVYEVPATSPAFQSYSHTLMPCEFGDVSSQTSCILHAHVHWQAASIHAAVIQIAGTCLTLNIAYILQNLAMTFGMRDRDEQNNRQRSTMQPSGRHADM